MDPETLVQGDPLRSIDAVAILPRSPELSEKVLSVRLAGMEFDALTGEPVLPKAPVNDVESRRLLRDEEHSSSLCQAIRDHVGDGLALARTGRTDDDEIHAFGGSEACGRLR